MSRHFNNDESLSSKMIYALNESVKDELKGVLSVSKLIEYISTPFDGEKQAKICEAKGKTDPNYKYAGLTAEEILQKWKDKADESKHYGNMLDDYAGLRLTNSEELDLWKLDTNYDYDLRLNANCKGFDEFYEMIQTKTNYKFVSREMSLFASSPNGNKIKGRFDCLFYDENTNSYIIIDWKTTDDIELKNSYGTKLLGPCYELDDCAGNKYTIQLQLYKKALVETYKLTDETKISIYVCNVLKQPDPTTGKYYKLIKQNIEYNNDLLNKLIDFANTKHKLLNKV